MQAKTLFKFRAFIVLLLALLLIVPSLSVSAQDDDGYYDDYYDDGYYDDGYYDDYYDDGYYDDGYYDDGYYDDYYDDGYYDDYYDDGYYDDYYDDGYYDDYYDDGYYDDYYDDGYYDDYYDDGYYDDYYDDGYYDDYYDDGYYDEYYDDYYYDDEYYDDFYDDSYTGGYSDDEEVLASYDISGTQLVGTPSAEHLALWNAFVALIPSEYLSNFSSFEVTNSQDTSGYVYGDENDPSRFVLGLNILELNNRGELRHTIIHEFAHVITLNSAQIDGTIQRGATCSTFELEEGCSENNSYIYAFHQAFYANGSGSGSSNFVTDYASTNIAEDMAESFTLFVIQDAPTGATVADSKINFFYNYPELVEMRNQIRANMGN